MRHDYDPILRAWTYGGPNSEGFGPHVDGYNFWVGDVARGLVGVRLGMEQAKDRLKPGDTAESKAAETGGDDLVEFVRLAKAARLAAINAGIC